jgi:4-diphosphocytidyl-2-C-methyl-D-erythritol kinase
MTVGLALGADIPFFLGGTAAFVEGIGERLTPIALPAAHYALVHPAVSVPTATIFGAAELTRDTEVIRLLDFSKNGLAGIDTPPTGPGRPSGPGRFRNDLEPVARARFDAVREALEWLSRGADRDWDGALGVPRMSGSGACVFRAFDSDAHAAACIAALPARWTGWSVRSLAVHPLAAS